MKKCPRCGRVHSDLIDTCLSCKIPLSGTCGPSQDAGSPAANHYSSGKTTGKTHAPQAPLRQIPQAPVPQDPGGEGSRLWFVPSVCVPLVGWILYFSWKDTKPVSARAANAGAWVGFLGAVLMGLAG